MAAKKAATKKAAKKAATKKAAKKEIKSGERTGTDLRGHEVKKYKADGVWYVEKNNNGAVHPVACVNESEANDLFEQELNEVD